MATVYPPANFYDLLLLAANLLCEAFKPVNNVAVVEMVSSVLLRRVPPISTDNLLARTLARYVNLTSERSYTCSLM